MYAAPFAPPRSEGRPLRSHTSSSSSSSAGGVGENVGCSDTLTDLRRVGGDSPDAPPFAEIVDALKSDSSFPGTTNEEADTNVDVDAEASAGDGVSSSRTVRKDPADSLSLPSSLRRAPLRAGAGAGAGAGEASDSTTTRGGAEGITMGVGGGTGESDWFRSALRNGIFGAVPGGIRGIGTRGGGSDVGRDDVDGRDDDDATGGAAANTLPGARTDSNGIPLPPAPRRLYFDTDGGARTLNKPPTVLVPPAGPGGRPAFARSHAVRLFLVTPSTIAMSDIWLEPARPASACAGACAGGDGGLVYVADLLLRWLASGLLRPTAEPGVECEEGNPPSARSPELRRFTGGALPGLRTEPCRDTFVLDERAIASMRRSVFGFAIGFAGVGVDDPGTETSEELTVTADERAGADVRAERGEGLGDASGTLGRLLMDPLRSFRPLTAPPSLIQP